MTDVYIDLRGQNEWITKYLSNKDFISIDELLGVIEDIDSKIESIKNELEDLKKDKWENEEDKKGYYADMYYELEQIGG